MRSPTAAVIAVLLVGSTAFAAETMAPSDIRATFFNGQPFTASTPSGGTQFKMTFTSDGKMIRGASRTIWLQKQRDVEARCEGLLHDLATCQAYLLHRHPKRRE